MKTTDTATYTPSANSMAARLIAHLHDGGIGIRRQELATVFGVHPNSANKCLGPALEAGLLVETGARGQRWYHLPGQQTAPAAQADAASGNALQRTAAPARRSSTRKGKKARAATPAQRSTRAARVAADAAAQAAADEAATPMASLWDDGDVQLVGIAVTESTSSATLNDQQARQLHRFLHRVYGPGALGDTAAGEARA